MDSQDVSGDPSAARRTWAVAGISAVAMVLEIAGGRRFGSVALTAEGLHMAAHVGVYGVAGLAYLHARRSGHGRAGAWAALVNAVVLLGLATLIAVEALERLRRPEPVAFDLAIGVGVFGLVVNLLCAALLGRHGHDHHGPGHHEHEQPSHSHGNDLNLRAVYLHVLSDAATAVLALAGLLAGRLLGWTWTDAAAGLAGAVLVGSLGLTLARRSTAALRS